MQTAKVLEEFDSLIPEAMSSGLLEPCEKDIFFCPSSGGKKMALVAATHGNEPIGVKLFSNLLQRLQKGSFEAEHSFYLILANRKAYEKGVRFVEEDLNRSYHLQSTSHEGQRAKEISRVLQKCDFVLDIHQTLEKTLTPFFLTSKKFETDPIFSCFPPLIPFLITPDSSEITTTRSFLMAQGKPGVTLELSDRGFADEALRLGGEILESLLKFDFSLEEPPSAPLYDFKLLTPFPGGRNVKWRSDLQNFQEVKKGERVATIDGKPVFSCDSGHIMLYPAEFFLWKNPPKGFYGLFEKRERSTHEAKG